MFGDLMGNLEKSQKDMKKKLAKITVEGTAGDGAVKVTSNCNREIVNIVFDKTKLDWEDQDMVEELLISAINKALQNAAEKEAAEAQNLMNDMLPPGLSSMFGQ